MPVWAYWSPNRWAKVGMEAEEIFQARLGWDITDFGSGNFAEVGLVAFTIRNGSFSATHDPLAKNYCEKMLICDEEQITPTHFHWSKMEDIINRGGGKLVIELWNSKPETEELDKGSEVIVSVDGIVRKVPAGGKVVLEPGESITLAPRVYHNFYGQKGCGKVLGGEVSRVNDDERDNRFNPPLPRFSEIEQDEPPKHLLCSEYLKVTA